MKSLRFSFYVVAALLAVMTACAPKATSVPPTAVIPATGNTSIPATILIQHQAIPNQLPDQRSNQAGDQDSSTTAKDKTVPGGDRFTFGKYERPFNADTMDTYFPYLDIQNVTIYQDDTWVYGVIIVKGRDANNAMPGKYAVELDVNRDGRGDFFVIVTHPASTDWTTDGVQVWADTNKDVGGSTAVQSDKTLSTGDGYETLVFDSGQGQDADAAWARLSPADPNGIQLAVKRSVLGGAKAYMAGMWAGNDDLNPALFDINDHFTHDAAGEASRDLEYYYPIKQVSELDNTCRMAVGFVPTGSEPLLCPSASGCQPPAGGCNTANGYHWDASQCCCAYYDVGCGY